MKRILSFCSTSIFFLFLAAATVVACPMSSTVLNFEDIGVPSNDVFDYIPDGYGGFYWDNFGYVSATIGGYGIEGDYSAFNGWGEDAFLTNDDPFDFHSALFKGAWNNGLNILITAYSPDRFSVFQETITVDTISPFLFSPDDWNNLDGLSFSSYGGTNVGLGGGGTHFAMDEFTFSPSNNSAPVPEPATIFLIGSGLLGLAGLGKWQQKKERD